MNGPGATTVIDYCVEIPVRPAGSIAGMEIMFQWCRSGFPAECLSLDVDLDGDVDLHDAAVLFRDHCYISGEPEP
jgi:hypothetical protein